MVVTFIFIIVDRNLAKNPDRWDPRKPGHPFYPNLPAATKTTQRVPRIDSLSRLVALSVLIVWLRSIQQSPFLILGPAAAFLKLAPVWHQLYLPAVLLALAGMVLASINLLRPDWVQLHSIARIGMGIATLMMWCLLLKAGYWIVSTGPSAGLEGIHPRTLEIINKCFFYGLLVAVAIAALQVFRDLRGLAQGAHNRVSSRA